MATTNKTFQADVALAFKTQGAEELEKLVAKLLSSIDSIPEKSKSANKATGELFDKIKEIAKALKDPAKGTFNDVALEVKTLAAAMKSLQTLTKGAELFSNKDVENINSAAAATRAYAKAYNETQKNTSISKGIFGLDESTIKGITAATKVLQTQLDAVKQSLSAIDGRTKVGRNLLGQERALTQNISSLDLRGTEIADAAAQKKLNDGVVADLIKASKIAGDAQGKIDSGLAADRVKASKIAGDAQGKIDSGLAADRVKDMERQGIAQEQLRVRGANGRFIAADKTAEFATTPVGIAGLVAKGANTDMATGLAGLGLTTAMLNKSIEIRAVERDRKALVDALGLQLIKNGDTVDKETKSLNAQIQALDKKLSVQKQVEKNTPEAKAEAEANRANSMMARVSGQGGAALLAVQASLIANYAVLTTAIGGVRSAISTAVELEAAFRNVQAVTATTSTEMVGLESTIRSVAATSKFSSVEVANAALVMGQAGMSAKQVGEAIPSVVALAVAAGTTLAQAVDLVTSVLGVFNKSSADTADIANKITQAANSSKVSVEKLALGLQYAGNIAAQSGISFEETTAAMATMSNAGIKSGSTLGTGLRQFLTEVEKPSTEFLKIIQGLGLAISDLDFRSHGLIGVVTKLHNAGFAASEAIKSFDTRGASAFNAMLADPAALDRQYQGLLNTKAAVTANEIQMDSLKSQTARLTTSMGNLASTGLEPVSTVLKGLAGGLATVVQAMTEYPGVVQAMTVAAGSFIVLGLGSHYVGIAAAGLRLAGVTQMLTASMGLLLSPVGLVWAGFAAISAAFLFYESSSEKAKKATDALKAASSEAKSAFEEKAESVKSLTKKIEDLQYREATLKGDTAGLTREAMALNAQFGSLGLQIDTNNPLFEEMIQKLRGVKKEMQDIAGIKLETQIRTGRELLEKQTKTMQEEKAKLNPKADAKRDSRTPGLIDRIEAFIKTRGIMDSPNLGGEQAEKIPGYLSILRNPEATASQNAGVATLLETLKAGSRTKGDLAEVDKFVNELAPFLKSANEATESTGGVLNNQAIKSSREADKQLQAAKIFPGGKTLSEFAPHYYGVESAVKLEQPELAPVPLAKESKKRAEAALVLNEEAQGILLDAIAKKLVDSAAGMKALTEQKGIAENFKAGAKATLSAVQKRIDQDHRGELLLLEQKATASKLPADQLAVAKAKARHATVMAVGKDENAEAQAENDLKLGEAKAAAAAQKIAKKTAAELLNEEIASASKQAENHEMQARGARISASNADSMERVGEFLQKGAQSTEDANTARLKGLALKQKKRTLEGGTDGYSQSVKDAETAAEKEDGETRIRNFALSFADVTSRVSKRIDKLGRGLDLIAKEGELKDLTFAGEERTFAAGAPARKLEREVASGSRLAGDVDIKQAVLIQTKTALTELTAQMKFLGDDTTGFVGELTKAFEEARDKRKALQATLGSVGVLSEAGRATTQVELEKQIGVEDKAQTALATYRKLGISTRAGVEGATNSVAQQERAIPQEASWKNLSERIDETWTKYQRVVRGMDVVKTVGDGFLTTLDSSTGYVASFFTNIATGSMTAANAFRSMATSMIKSMMDVLAQALAMQAVRGILGAFMTVGAATAGGGGADYSLSVGGGGTAGGVDMGGAGGLRMATGGPITGGIAGRDSVGILAMPGEFMLKKTAVDAVGQDFLTGLNNTTNRTLSGSSGSSPFSSKGAGAITNVWVVAPNNPPAMGPRDVVVAITDDMMRGGMTRTLIKQIQSGA